MGKKKWGLRSGVRAIIWITGLFACTSEQTKNADTSATAMVPPKTLERTSDAMRVAPNTGLLVVLRDTLRARNPNIDSVSVLEVKATGGDAASNVFIGYGVRGDFDFKGSFDDELYGVFVANDSLTRIVRVLDIFPTPRWRDYVLRIGAVTADSVTIQGAGGMYEDQGLRRSYRWH